MAKRNNWCVYYIDSDGDKVIVCDNLTEFQAMNKAYDLRYNPEIRYGEK